MAARAVRGSWHRLSHGRAEPQRALSRVPAAVNSGRVDLLDSSRMVAQFVGLERRTSRAGKDSVDHAPGAHDDISNSVAGASSLASVVRPTIPIVMPIIIGKEEALVSSGLAFYVSGDVSAAYRDKRNQGFSRRIAGW